MPEFQRLQLFGSRHRAQTLSGGAEVKRETPYVFIELLLQQKPSQVVRLDHEAWFQSAASPSAMSSFRNNSVSCCCSRTERADTTSFRRSTIALRPAAKT